MLRDVNSSFAPSFSAHKNFLISVKAQPCGYVHQVSPEERCAFILENPECREAINYVDYVHFMYCEIDSSNWLTFGLGAFFLLFLVILMCCIVHDNSINRYVPSILCVCKCLHLNEYLAGITVLTFGNGLVKVVSDFEQVYNIDTEPIYNQYLGTSLFEITVISAIIVLNRRFYVFPEFLIPNVITLVVACSLLQYFMATDQITMGQNLILLAIYLAYVASIMTISIIVRTRLLSSHATNVNLERALILVTEIGIRDRTGRMLDVRMTEDSEFIGTNANERLLSQFWDTLKPFSWNELETASVWIRSAKLFVVPIQLMITLLVPAVSYDLPMHGWSKLMFVVNFNLFPIFFIACIFGGDYSSEHLLLFFALSLAITLLVSVVICLSTRTDRKPPAYLGIALFSMFGIILISLLIVYEIVAIIQTLAIIMNISRASLGITLLSWGNCWVHAISNLELARKGYPRLGFSACLGGPLFNILIGMFIVFTTRMIQFNSFSIAVREGASGPTCVTYLVVTSILLVLLLSFSDFQARVSLAYFLLIIYGVFLLHTLLCEFEVIHPFGTDHNDDGEHSSDVIPGVKLYAD